MDPAETEHWFAANLADFAALGRGDLEISWLEATYLITDGPAGRRISAVAIHSTS